MQIGRCGLGNHSQPVVQPPLTHQPHPDRHLRAKRRERRLWIGRYRPKKRGHARPVALLGEVESRFPAGNVQVCNPRVGLRRRVAPCAHQHTHEGRVVGTYGRRNVCCRMPVLVCGRGVSSRRDEQSPTARRRALRLRAPRHNIQRCVALTVPLRQRCTSCNPVRW